MILIANNPLCKGFFEDIVRFILQKSQEGANPCVQPVKAQA
jgi:hypothetical protein